jgi:hypothetical protein
MQLVYRYSTVYPSDFGLERMKVESVHGPLAAFGGAVQVGILQFTHSS